MPIIRLAGSDYEVLDAIEYMTIPDCFVAKNKLGSGHGEAKFYVGNENKRTLQFFDDFNRPCFVTKTDLGKYLVDAFREYTSPAQAYLNKEHLAVDYAAYVLELEALADEMLGFRIFRANVRPPRLYINSNDEIYNFIRKIALPEISYMSALKLRCRDGGTIYYFRPFIDYHYFGENEHPQTVILEEANVKKDKSISVTEKKQLIISRRGQGTFRDRLLKESSACLMTGVTDERMLVASHIKPWVKASNFEKLDPLNGLVLSPTYDRLFDIGFITFTAAGLLKISPYLSPMNQKRLFLKPNKQYSFNFEKRGKYLDYHQKECFKS